MGWIKDVKAQTAGKTARAARDAGQTMLVYKLIEANTNSHATGPMNAMAEQIQAIEAEGWTLTNFAVGEGKALTGERVALICLFRLASTA